MKIVIDNLPPGVTEDALRAALAGFAPVRAVVLVRDGGPCPTALVDLDASHAQAEVAVRRIDGHIHEGRALHAWIPLREG